MDRDATVKMLRKMWNSNQDQVKEHFGNIDNWMGAMSNISRDVGISPEEFQVPEPVKSEIDIEAEALGAAGEAERAAAKAPSSFESLQEPVETVEDRAARMEAFKQRLREKGLMR
jgi:hypothetical protein